MKPEHSMWDDRRHFEWADLLDAVEHGDTPHWPSRKQSIETGESQSWDLGLGFTGALALARGQAEWKEGREQIERTAREQAEKYVAKRAFIDYGYDVTGEFFDVAAVLEGRPECWLRPTPTGTGAAALVRLVIDLGTSGGVPASVMRERMTAVAAAVLTLEACGNPVEVVACDSSQGEGSYLFSYVVCKPGDPVDVTRIVALAHPAFFRRIVFRVIEQTTSPEVHRAHSYGYGECPRPIPDAVLAAEFGSHVVYIPPCDVYSQAQPTAATLLRMVQQRMGYVGTDDYDGANEVEED